VNFVAKGSNLFTEHYSGLVADVPDPADPSTKINTALLDTLNEADEILFTGEALSHCVANTITDIANNFGVDNIKKFVLLDDTSSNVTGCDKLGQDFVKNMVAKGMRITNTRDW
jgi:nicotinamidase-related amidase